MKPLTTVGELIELLDGIDKDVMVNVINTGVFQQSENAQLNYDSLLIARSYTQPDGEKRHLYFDEPNAGVENGKLTEIYLIQ